MTPDTDGDRITTATAYVAAAGLGLTLWFGVNTRVRPGDQGQDDQLPLFLGLLLLGGVVLSVIWPRLYRSLPIALVAPQMLVAPFTAPRGDGDGLWVFVFVELLMIVAVLIGIGTVVAAGRKALAARNET